MLDSLNRTIGYFPVELVSNQETPVVVIKVVAGNKVHLTCEASPNVITLARQSGTANAFQDISASPIDLSGFTPGSVIAFDVKCRGGNIQGRVIDSVCLATVVNKAAGWAN